MKPAWALLALAACGPTVAWYGRTPDRRQRLALVEEAGVQYLTRDGRRGAGWPAIALSSLAFSPAGEVAYAARHGRGWVVVRDERAGEAWDGVAELRFSPDGARLAHLAERDDRWTAVVDDAPGPWFDAVLAGTLTFSADGGHLAWVGVAGGKSHVVVDGKPGPGWGGVGALAFAGARAVYTARRGGDVHRVDGVVVGPAWRQVTGCVVYRERTACAARDDTGWHVLVDGAARPTTEPPRDLVFSRDGHRLGWIEGTRVVVDGVGLPSALAIGSLSFRDDGEPMYTERVAAGWRVVTGGAAGPAFAAVTAPVTAGARWAYAGRRGGHWIVVVDGREVTRERWASSPVFSPAGGRVAWLAARGRRVAAVVDGRASVYDFVEPGTLTFSRDGRRWGCVAGALRERRLFLVIDGRDAGRIDVDELAAEAIRGSPRPLVTWVSAELDRPR